MGWAARVVTLDVPAVRAAVEPGPAAQSICRLAIAVACGAVTLFFTYSRMLWVALPVGLAAWILWSLPRRAAWIALILSAIGGAGLLTLPAVRDRLANTMGTSERQALWRANLELFEMRPITGAGWHHNLEAAGWLLQQKQRSEQVFSGHAHNNFLEMLGGTGALGLLAWLVWWGVALALLKNVFATRVGFVRGLACAWIVFQINGLTQVNFWESKVLHQLMWTMGWLLLWNREIGWPAKRSAS
jgi:O-antigen ligase